jgi:deoxyribonuclease-4
MWEKSRLALKEELRRCDQLGVPYLVSHPGAHVGSGADAGVTRVGEAVNRIHDEMPESKAMLLLETTAGQGTCLGARFEELAAMIDVIEDKSRVGVCFDTCHVFAAGYELRDLEGFEVTVSAFDEIVGLDRINRKVWAAGWIAMRTSVKGNWASRPSSCSSTTPGFRAFRAFLKRRKKPRTSKKTV